MDENLKLDAEDIFCDDPAAVAALNNFGIKYLYPWQRLVIANILDTQKNSTEPAASADDEKDTLKNQIVLLPTGAGKSLCFQIPALLLDGPSLIIYPLLALMSDQFRRMTEGGLNPVIFRGGQTISEREDNFQKLNQGSKIIIANPEVLESKELTDRLMQLHISHIAIDEAHCVSEWGDSFRPSYLKLGSVLKKLNVPVVTAFTATASPEVLSRIADVLFEGEAHIVRSESDRPNIHYYVKKIASKKQAVLTLSQTEKRPMIIFCGSRSRTEDMAQELNTAFGKVTAKFYHAGLEREEKTEIEKWFYQSDDGILCATCAYGMGVDKKNIHTVIHLDPPETAEAYIQEAGRGGRDGSVANAILLWNQEDRKKFGAFRSGTRKAALRDFAETTECRRQILLDALGAEKALCDGCDICDEKRLAGSKKNISGMKYLPETVKKYFSYKESLALHLQNTKIPGSVLPSDTTIMERLIDFAGKYFTEETLETFFTDLMNSLSRPVTGINIWHHEGFSNVFNELLSRRKIRICKWPWKGRIDGVKNKRRRMLLLRLLNHQRIKYMRNLNRLWVPSLQLLHLQQVSVLQEQPVEERPSSSFA